MTSHVTQISAYVSEDTKELLETYAAEHGVKKGHLVEEALRHHLLALREVPLDVVVPAGLLVSPESGERVLERIEKPRRPNAAMKRLFTKRSGKT